MLVALWIVNGLLALAFLGAGLLKVTRTNEQLRDAGMTWTEGFTSRQVTLIGVAEVLGALGLVLPLATGIAPVLAPVAAVALAGTMVGAVVVHVRRSESPAPAVALGVLSLVSAVLGFVVLLG
ncbi:DoxX family protein [Cellulomonas sp. S1-8]|uniref:DoxX family protein n=1 Tax=Cellulomonas sp. S1-8 TaxID=2904790 RepID=UPI00224301C3|nr:DoxX family protein [Cellulomonas sp. S1-8]UZN03638.1 DoxX family protein [Cellulomonas sp. S1-8]